MPHGEGDPSTTEMIDTNRLIAAKSNTTVSVVLPAHNEDHTIVSIIEMIRDTLMTDEHGRGLGGLVDELMVMDDSSTDHTAEVARRAGATVVPVAEVLAEYGPASGKGNVLWKSVAATSGDIIVWIDADLTSFGPNFIISLLGPLLTDDSITLVKGYYQRPEVNGVGGGRTTEIMARPLISTFFPHLATIRQPLGGEYAARRSVLERLPFCEGYGVEAGLLIDIAEAEGADSIAQVDLGVRRHRVRPLHDLTTQAMEVLHAVMRRTPGVVHHSDLATVLIRPDRPPVNVVTGERPPLITCPGYQHEAWTPANFE